MNNDIILIKQLPVIEERLHELKAEISERVSAAVTMDCTENTVKEIKKIRAELNKEFAEYEEARKGVKKAISEPYDRFNATYKECVSDVFKAADGELRRKVAAVEDGLKKAKHENVKRFAVELRAASELEWLDVDRVIPNVTLSSTESSLIQKTSETIERISEDVKAIDDPEVFAEYKKTLNLAQAQTSVKNRRAEIERAKAESLAHYERIKKQVENMAVEAEMPEALEPPTVSIVQEPVYTMSFTVKGTIDRLKAVKAFLVENNIEFIGG